LDIEKKANPGVLDIKPYVPGKSIEEVQRTRRINGAVKMASNENLFGISPKAMAAIQDAAHTAYRYPERDCPALAHALATELGLARENIVVGNGADGVIYALGMCLLDEKDETIIPAVTFPLYEIIARTMRARIITAPMKEYSLDLEGILQRISRRTKLIWICNPNNPTGTLIEKIDLGAFLDRVPSHVVVALDEVYHDFVDPQLASNTIEMIRGGRGNLFLIRSFSKVYGLAGVRLGYGVGSEDMISLLYRVRPPFDTSWLAEAAGRGALEDREFYDRTLRITKMEKQYLSEELERMELSFVPSHTNFILIDTGRDGEAVCEGLVQSGVIVRPCKNYNLPSHIRVTIGQRAHNERFVKALAKILK
jgi:histidinol-phosphate aminotransferase